MIALLAMLPLLAQTAPKVWTDAAMAQLEVPLAKPEFSPKHASAESYYNLPVVEVFKSYPVYGPGKEPGDYIGFLQAQQPESAWDASKLKTEGDWIRAGEFLFDSPTRIGRIAYTPSETDPNYIHYRAWFEKVKPALSFEGALPSYRYVVRRKGIVEVGWNACSMCHSRIMPSGIVEMGPGSQFPFDAAFAEDIRKSGSDASSVAKNRLLLRSLYFTPWIRSAVIDQIAGYDHQQMALLLEGHADGTMAIDRTTPWASVKVPDLIGVGAMKYLDHTGLHIQRSVEDLERYIATHFAGDHLATFGTWNASEGLPATRFSDDQLHALALYLTSLKPPKNPNKANAFSKKGRAVFEREGCPACHPAPLYTNNKLSPAPGFQVPDKHKTLYDIIPESIGTDPALALETRRGTGYYRVPALTGVWYRGPFGHNGVVGELEQWLDSGRLRNDYFQAGFGGLSGRQGAVKGHEFGMRLNDQDRAALVAFLRTL
jgi:hypothetical protein